MSRFRFMFYDQGRFQEDCESGAYTGGVKTPTFLENFSNLLGFFEKKIPNQPKFFHPYKNF